MKVVILCGGIGTRLKEETEFKPKPMVEIGGMPILWHIMKMYSFYGHREFILCLGYKGQMIKQYFLNFEQLSNDFTLNLRDNKAKIQHHDCTQLEDWKIHLVDTGQETMTGGRIKRIQHLIGNDEDFFLTYGDGLSDININEVYRFHKKKNRTLTISAVSPESVFGIIDVKDGDVTSFKEKPRLDGRISGGFFVCKNKIFDYIKGDETIFEQEPMKQIVKEGEAAAYEYDGFWYCMDTHKHAAHLNKLWASDPPWKVWKDVCK